jgi:hypothetical protein
MTASAALKLLRSTSKDGVIETPSYTTLAALIGWDRARTWKAVQRWAKAGKVIIESGPDDNKLVLRIPPDRNALARGKGTGVAAPQRGAGKRRKASPAAAIDGANPESISASIGTQIMSLFPRSGKPAETPPAPTVEPEALSQSPVTQYGYGYPATAHYRGTPALHAEKLNWKVQPRTGERGGDVTSAGGGTAGFDTVDAFRRANVWERLLILIAFALSGTAAYVSVNGMLTLYPAAGGVILVMGGLMEALKFVGFGVVSAGWKSYGATSRSIFSILLLTAALVNAGGVYGWLISQHTAPAAARSATFTAGDGDAAARVEVAQAKLNDLDKRLSLIDGAAEGAARRGRANSALNAIQDQKKPRAAIEAERERAVKELADLRAGRAGLAAQRQVDEAAALPVRYAAALFEDVGILRPGTDPEKLFRWISFFILLCGDPAALAAMFMVNSRGRRKGAAA